MTEQNLEFFRFKNWEDRLHKAKSKWKEIDKFPQQERILHAFVIKQIESETCKNTFQYNLFWEIAINELNLVTLLWFSYQ